MKKLLFTILLSLSTALGATGTGIVNPAYVAPDANAVARTYRDKVSDVLHVKDFGVVCDGTDEKTKLAAAFAAAVGRVINLVPGATCTSSDSLVLPAGAALEMNGATLKFTTTGSEKNLDLRGGNVVQGGTIENAGSGFTGSGDAGSPIIIGDYGVGAGYANIVLRNLTIKTAKPEGNGITIVGDSHDIVIENIDYPDSAYLMTALLIHWGGANAPASGTTHPYNIAAENLRVGTLGYAVASDAGTVTLSGAYNVNIRNVEVKKAHNAGLYIYVGDYGKYYAPAAVAPLLGAGIRVENFSVRESDKYGFYIRGDAAAAPGAPLYPLPVQVVNFSAVGSGAAGDGGYLKYAQDSEIINARLSNFANGIATRTASCKRVKIIGGEFTGNVDDGLYLINGAEEFEVVGVWAYANGYAGLETTASNTRILRNVFGVASEASQDFGMRTGPSSVGDQIENNVCLGATNTCFSLANGTSYGTVAIFAGNTVAGGVVAPMGGLLHVPFAVYGAGDSAVRVMYGASAPAAGAWRVGDRVVNTGATVGQPKGWRCTVAGTPGTWVSEGAL